MKCPDCKTNNPNVTGWFGCTPGVIFYIFDCCGRHGTKKDYLKGLIRCANDCVKELNKIQRERKTR